MMERQVPKYAMTIEWSSAGSAFIVTIPGFPDCRTHGESYEDAARNGQEIIELVVAGLIEDAQKIPVASTFQRAEPVDFRSRPSRKAVRRAS